MIGWVRNVFAWRSQRRDEVGAGSDWHLSPDDRVGVLPKRARGRKARRSFVLVAGVAGVAYASYREPKIALRAWALASSLASSLMPSNLAGETAHRPLRQPSSRAAEAPAATQRPEPSPVADEPKQLATHVPEPADTALPNAAEQSANRPIKSLPSAQAHAARASIPYAPPELATVNDPYETKAKVAGLHPDLSRALLMELTELDYRNARIATDTALAILPDDAVLRWPKRREAGLAMFEVRFVPGASDACRRYIVTIEKNRWITTSAPIEKCGMGSVKLNAEAKLP